jgi:hypothetical protein
MATITVDVYLDEFNEDDIVNELEHRGYYVSKDTPSEGFDREDWQFLLDLLDKQPETWYTRRVREKLSEARFR